MKIKLIVTIFTTAIAAVIVTVNAQDAHTVPKAGVKYSPYPEENFPNQVLFSDTHLHTGHSTDAGMVGCTLGPEDAYRFARGETVTSNHGLKVGFARFPRMRFGALAMFWVI